jgi:DNA polymerase-3 subunit alpha
MHYTSPRIPEQPRHSTFHLTLLAKNKSGLKNLLALMRESHDRAGKQSLTLEQLSKRSKGLIVLSGCLYGAIQNMAVRHGIASGDIPHRQDVIKQHLYPVENYDKQYAQVTTDLVKQLKEIAGEDFYIEVQDHGLPEQKYFVDRVAPFLSKTYGVPLVATNDVHYIHKDQALAHGYAMAIKRKQRGGTISVSPNVYLKTREEMERLFPSDVLDRTLEIADKVNDRIFDITKSHPVYNTGGRHPDNVLTEVAWENFYKIYGHRPGDHPLWEEAKERLEMELDTITSLGFSDYLLIVSDIIKKTVAQTGRLPGPGRGSAAGSILVYVLGITQVEPLKHGLLFSRFLSKARFTVNEEASLDVGNRTR